jgi:methylated-DNA-[protein]-cysteine S-methyltransferase
MTDEQTIWAGIDTPLGRVGVAARAGAIVAVRWGSRAGQPETPLLVDACRQVGAYFAHERESFDLPLDPGGSEFERAVWRAMLAIPYGHTRTYGAIAAELGGMPQPVGQACGANPLPIVVPCHRVVAADGLGGFSAAGGVETKVALLRHEGAYGLLL